MESGSVIGEVIKPFGKDKILVKVKLANVCPKPKSFTACVILEFYFYVSFTVCFVTVLADCFVKECFLCICTEYSLKLVYTMSCSESHMTDYLED